MKLRTKTNHPSGLTLIELMVVLCVIYGLVVFAYFANRGNRSAQAKARRIYCLNSQKQLGLGFNAWAADHEGKFPMQVAETNGGAMTAAGDGQVLAVFQVVVNANTNYSVPRVLSCPADVRRDWVDFSQTNFSASNLSYLVNSDANPAIPTTVLLGDRNLSNGLSLRGSILEVATNRPVQWTAKELHNGVGNLALADGSAWRVSNPELQSQWVAGKVATNHLLIP